MEINMDELILDINRSKKAEIGIYLFDGIGLTCKSQIYDNIKVDKEQDGSLYLEACELGYLINEDYEICRTVEASADKPAQYEIRRDELLCVTLFLSF